MNLDKMFSPLFTLRGTVLAGLIAIPVAAQAGSPIFWTGPNTNFSQSGGSVDVLVPGAVALDRNANGRLYNQAAHESSSGPASPSDTEWATATPGVIANLTTATTLTYVPFNTWVGGHNGGGTVANFIKGKPAVIHLITENIYIAVNFSGWGEFFSGGFAYTRSTAPAVVVQPPPTVSLTNPMNNAVFAAPADVKLGATAAVSTGTVTNVSFFNGTTFLGSAQASPFNATANGLTAGAYALTAVATAGGVSTTSAVVNFSVVTPVPVTTSVPGITNGQFSFSYSATPKLTYVVQDSSNLLNWLPLITNTPASSPVTVTDTFSSNSVRFYRVGQAPNP